jgi:UDP-2,3-diacylglucosamine pyrophosphatase LpxH
MTLAPRYRTIWISDIHLGMPACKANELLDFLRNVEADTIYLVGDIVDGWRRGLYWPQEHNDIIQKLLRKGRKGSKLVYLPGNHDDMMRRFVGQTFGGIRVVDDCVHEAADGRRYLVIHGDQFDFIMQYAVWLAKLGQTAYDLLLALNANLARIRRLLGLPYWSISSYMKQRTKKALDRIGGFERRLVGEARRRGLDGVICGHTHQAETKLVDGILYINDGDWVESCTALVEHSDGRLEILDWTEALAERIVRLPALQAA